MASKRQFIIAPCDSIKQPREKSGCKSYMDKEKSESGGDRCGYAPKKYDESNCGCKPRKDMNKDCGCGFMK